MGGEEGSRIKGESARGRRDGKKYGRAQLERLIRLYVLETRSRGGGGVVWNTNVSHAAPLDLLLQDGSRGSDLR